METPNELLIEDNDKEFNSQVEFFRELYRIRERRNLGYETGNIEMFYRSTRSLLSCSSPKMIQEGIDIAPIKEKLKLLWNKIKSMVEMNNDILIKKNSRVYEFELMEISDEINEMIHEAGIIYPKRKKKTIKEAREEDF